MYCRLNCDDNVRKNFLFFILSRLASIALLFVYLPTIDERFFAFADLQTYSEGNNVIGRMTGPLYSELVRITGYSVDNLHSIQWITISIIMSIIVSLPWIFLSSRLFNARGSIVYSLALGFHPYLALYSLKIDTTFFAIIPIFLVALTTFFSKERVEKASLIITTVFTFLRSSLIPLSAFQMLIVFFQKSKRRGRVLFFPLIMLIISCLLQLGFAVDFLSSYSTCLSVSEVNRIIASGIDMGYVTTLLSLLVVPIVHVLLILSAREAIYVQCTPLLPASIASSYFFTIISSIFFLAFNGYLLYRLIDWVLRSKSQKAWQIMLPFSILLPSLYGPAHMRYLLPIIPLMLIFLPPNKSRLRF